jgi:hypothetical protein
MIVHIELSSCKIKHTTLKHSLISKTFKPCDDADEVMETVIKHPRRTPGMTITTATQRLKKEVQKTKRNSTFNSWDSPVVTHLTTSQPI